MHMRFASILGFLLLVTAAHAQELPVKPEVQNTEDLAPSGSIIFPAQEQFTTGMANSEELISKVNPQPSPDKPKPVAREGQWIPASEDWPQISDDLVVVARKNDGRMTWHVEKVNSCVWCGAPMTWKQAMFDKKSSSMWVVHSMLVIADIEITHHLPCFQARTCRELNPLLGQTRLQGYSVAAGLNAFSWIGDAWLRKGNREYRVGGYRHWWIVPAIGDVISGFSIMTNLASWHGG
jgi:hypothetical protein